MQGHGVGRETHGGPKKKLIAGFRWAFKTQGGSPLDCAACSDRDIEARNCGNRLGLSEDAKSVTEYSDEVNEELKEKGARKVFTLDDIRLYECPLSYISEDTRDLMRISFLMDDNKRLLHAGGWGDQPFWLIETYEIFRMEAVRNMPKGKDANGE